MTGAYDGRQVVGMDMHRLRSVPVRMTEDGRKLETVRIARSPAALRAVIARAGGKPRVVIEATDLAVARIRRWSVLGGLINE